MKKTNLLLLAMSLLSVFVSCQKETEIDKLDWLVGTWEQQTENGTFTEVWTKTSQKDENGNQADYLQGTSSLVKNGETLFSEQITLTEKENKLVYSVIAGEQNGGQAVDFTTTKIEKGDLVFENPTHDFPKKITYKLVTKDSLYAEISGDGKSQGFPFKKKK